MSTEPRNTEIARTVVEMMDSLPGTPDSHFTEVLKTVMDYTNEKHAESRRMFTEDEAWHLAAVDFDLQAPETWPPAMQKMCDQDTALSCFFCDVEGTADTDMHHALLEALVYAHIAPEYAYACSLETAIFERSDNAKLVHDLAFRLDMQLSEIVIGTIEACEELMPRIAAVMPERTPRELMRGILAQVQAELAAKPQEEEKDV
jgi:hypothetical protein